MYLVGPILSHFDVIMITEYFVPQIHIEGFRNYMLNNTDICTFSFLGEFLETICQITLFFLKNKGCPNLFWPD